MKTIIINIIIFCIIIFSPVPGQADSIPGGGSPPEALRDFVNSVKGSSYWPMTALFSPDSGFITAGFSRNDFVSGSMIFRVDFRRDRVEALEAGFHMVRDVRMSPDNSFTIAAGGMGRNPFFEGEIILWSAGGNLLKIMDLESYSGGTFINSLAISGDSRFFLTGSELPTAKLYSRDGVLVRTFFAYGDIREYWEYGSSYEVDISSDRKHVLTRTKTGTKLWRFEGPLVRSFDDFTGKSFVCFTPDGKALAVIAGDALEFFDFTGNLIKSINAPVNGNALAPPAFTRDGKKAALLAGRGVILLIDIRSGSVREINLETGTTLKGGTISFGPGGDYIVYTHRGLPGFQVMYIPALRKLTFCCFDSGDWLAYDNTGFQGSPGALAIMEKGGFSPSHKPGLISGFFIGGEE